MGAAVLKAKMDGEARKECGHGDGPVKSEAAKEVEAQRRGDLAEQLDTFIAKQDFIGAAAVKAEMGPEPVDSVDSVCSSQGSSSAALERS